MHDNPPDRASGSVPHTFRLRMARQWVPQMPPELRRQKAFLYALATVAAMADAAGRTRWHSKDSGVGRPLRMKELASAMGSDEKDARRYLAAAIAAGILTTEQAPRRGRTTVYVLLVPPTTPRWAAAHAVLTAGCAAVTETDAHAAAGRTEFGGASPVLDSPARYRSSGDASPNSGAVTAGQVRGTSPHCSSGDASPLRTGDASPNTTRGTHEHPHEMVAVGPQVRDARGHEPHELADDSPSPAGPSPLRVVPPPRPGTRPGGRTPRMPDGQSPLLMPVPGPARPVERPAHAPSGDHSIGAPPDGWRAAVARERPEAASRVFRDRWTGPHADLLSDPTGT